MAETSGMFGAADDIRYYNQPQWLAFVRGFRADGYVVGSGSELAVVQDTPAAMTVEMGTGEAWIQGCWYSNSAVKTLTIAAADATYARYDRIVLRNDITGARTITAMVIKGTPAASPALPPLVRTEDIWDLGLAFISVTAGATTIVTSKITSTRAIASSCGAASPVAVRVADILTGTALDMAGFKLLGLSTPTADTDGCPYSYLQSKILSTPTGTPFWYAGATVPTGYLSCLGQAVSRTTYPVLFSIMGTTFGSGDGSTTFNLPDARGRSVFGYLSSDAAFDAIGKTGGEKTHVLTTAELPAHTHTATGAASSSDQTGAQTRAKSISNYATSDTGGGLAHANLQPYIVLKLIVRGA